jgi:hypothetical protein
MKRKLMLLGATLTFAFFILFSSVFQASAIDYKFIASPKPTASIKPEGIGPTHPLWPVKAAGQKISFIASGSYLDQAQKALDYSNERIAYAKNLFEVGQTNEGVAAMVKAGQYLETASQKEKLASLKGENTKAFLYNLLESSLFHKEVIDQISVTCSDEARAMVVKTGDLPVRLAAEAKAAIPSKK